MLDTQVEDSLDPEPKIDSQSWDKSKQRRNSGQESHANTVAKSHTENGKQDEDQQSSGSGANFVEFTQKKIDSFLQDDLRMMKTKDLEVDYDAERSSKQEDEANYWATQKTEHDPQDPKD